MLASTVPTMAQAPTPPPSFGGEQYAPQDSEYMIGPGDILNISVFGNDDLIAVTAQPNGQIASAPNVLEIATSVTDAGSRPASCAILLNSGIMSAISLYNPRDACGIQPSP
mgnify:CR=1 FL=1